MCNDIEDLSYTCGAHVKNLSFITRVVLCQTLPAGAIFDTAPRFDTSMTLLSRYINTFAYVNNRYIMCEGKSVKYNSTTENKTQLFRFGKGNDNVKYVCFL